MNITKLPPPLDGWHERDDSSSRRSFRWAGRGTRRPGTVASMVSPVKTPQIFPRGFSPAYPEPKAATCTSRTSIRRQRTHL